MLDNCVTYRDYIQSAAWRRRREAKLEAVRRKCQWCGDRQRLAVHHLNYTRLGCELSSDLIVLCNGCHWVADEMRKNPDSDLLERFRKTAPRDPIIPSMGSRREPLREFLARKRIKGV